MRDVIEDVARLFASGRTFGLATVVRTWKSAPRPAGASMAVAADGEAVGSVSGGCVEGAVYDLAQEVMASGRPVLQRYGVTDDDAFAVGLTCGGILDVFVETVSERVVARAARGRRVGPGAGAGRRRDDRRRPGAGRARSGRCGRTAPAGTLGSPRLDHAVTDDVRGMLEAGRTGFLHYGADGERRGDELAVFVQSFAPPPRMLVFGAIDFAAAVARHRPLPRLPRHGLRRPAGLRDDEALPGGGRGRRRVAAQVPRDAPRSTRARSSAC